MKAIIIAVLAAALIAGSVFFLKGKKPCQMKKAYESWKVANGKAFNSNEDDLYRFNIFKTNALKIRTHNADKTKTYTIGFTQFMDLTTEEFQALYLGGLQINDYAPVEVKGEHTTNAMDWRTKPGVIRPVKDQKRCGSCWAFSATGSIEGTSKIFKSNEDQFSEQQLVDCSKSYGNNGCRGGLMDYAFQYVRDKGILTEAEYPYVGVDQTCKKEGGFKIKGYINIPKGDISKLADQLNVQPISVAVDATNWSLYTGGIFNNCAKRLNHGVLLVAVDSTCWTIKNSWSTSWGEKGYMRLAPGDTCGIAQMSSYSTPL